MKKIITLLTVFILGLLLVSCKKNEVLHKVTFIVDGEELKVDLVKDNDFAKRPSNPELEGHEFDGWYKSTSYSDENRWYFMDEKIVKDTNLYGRFISDETPVEYFKAQIDLPSLSRLKDATAADLKVVEDAPELLIIGAVIDTYHYFQNESMSGYEYIKVFNNTNEKYNMKDHRILLADPLQGQNGETEEARLGNKSLVTGYLFNTYIDEDFIIEPLSAAIIWLKPYYWTIGSGTGAYNKTFSGDLVHTTTGGQKGAFEQTEQDFRDFYDMDSSTKIHIANNQPMIAVRPESGTDDFFPMITPGGGTPYTHLNGSLLRSIEIQKLDTQNGTAKVEILNKYKTLPPLEQTKPNEIFGKRAFNTIHLTDNGETVDTYFNFENGWKYFKPVVRIQLHGLIDETKLTSEYKGLVNFRLVESDTNPGIKRWDNTVEIQYRPPVKGERIMQMQLPLREARKITEYVLPSILEVIRYVEGETDYRWEKVEVYLLQDPLVTEINWRRDEIKSPGRTNAAAPTKIKLINLIRP